MIRGNIPFVAKVNDGWVTPSSDSVTVCVFVLGECP